MPPDDVAELVLAPGAAPPPDCFAIWTIYDNPTDCPGRFAVRVMYAGKGVIYKSATPAAVVGSLAEARAAVPPALYRQPRHPLDPPGIVETWF